MTSPQNLVLKNTISLLLPLPASRWSKNVWQLLRQTCDSLMAQGIDQWELLIGVTAEQKLQVKAWLKDMVLESDVESKHFRVVACPIDEAIGAINLNHLVKSARGDWVGLVLVGDQFAPHFVYECLMHGIKQPKVEMLYFDDDILQTKKGFAQPLLTVKQMQGEENEQALSSQTAMMRQQPQFKPDFSPDLLCSQNYIGLSFVVRRLRLVALMKSERQQALNFPMQLVLGLSQDIMADCKKMLPAWHKNHPIQRIGHVLRHRALANGSSVKHESSKLAQADAKRWVINHLKQLNFDSSMACEVSQIFKGSPVLRVKWSLPKAMPLVSIIVPTKDHYSILKVCLDSLLSQTTYPNYEVLVVDNQTTQVSALRYMATLAAKNAHVSVLKYDKPFNYSDINNQAVEQAQGDVLLFLNNDVEILLGDWLGEMVSHAVRPEIGCVGAKLLYPDRTIQHAGVSLGMHGVADHMYRGLSESSETDPYNYLKSVRNPGAVTGAVLAVRKKLFNQVGGFDAKNLPVAFNDVDLCLKAEKLGCRTVWTPYACLVHHESKTRAPRKVSKKSQVSLNVQSHATEKYEIDHMKACWGNLLKNKFRVLMHRHEPLRYL